MAPTTSAARVHLVLVPGFAGFDALGQLEYYAGVTPLLRRWQAGRRAAPPMVLHYFDNLPTASVATRAGRLRRWLAKRWARGELQPGDAVALVGHSTGGLDIRRLLLDLDAAARRAGSVEAVDGNRENACAVEPAELLALVRRAVFLSVPQRGTNIADFVRRLPRKAAIGPLRLLAGAANAWIANDLEEAAARGLGRATKAQLFLALGDTVAELDAHAVRRDLARVADAHEAASELELFLTHVASDFGAIEDLTAAPHPRRASPAHFDDAQRDDELRRWAEHGIVTRSYATVGRRPFRFEPGETVPPLDLLRLWAAPWLGLADGALARTDATYRLAYRACAGGPFGAATAARALAATALGTSERRMLEPWDNDGIVNTASMLWPDGEETRLVDADHGDVIGHYRLVEDVEGAPLRRYHTYDLLRSGCGFGEERFREVWTDVFEFCAGAALGASAEAA
ncbi:MAG TPA: hypothetical protein VFL83_22610 [Anaeromyxobacter sp.]|nr:hypothetical protein [Anaeromyxobacter sp.]